jgi:hypothetical protein
MAGTRPELHSIEDVMSFYGQTDGSAFKVFVGSYPKPEFCRYAYDGSEKTEGEQMLSDALVTIKQNVENTNTYTLQVIKKSRIKDPKSKSTISIETPSTQISFRLNSPDRYYGYGPGPQMSGGSPEVMQMLSQMQKTQNDLITKISKMEAEDQDEQEKPSGLGAILSNPAFQEMAIGAIAGLFGNFIKKNPMNNNALPGNFGSVQALAGVDPGPQQDPACEQCDKAQTAIQLLAQKDPNFGDHLLYLANLPDSKYKMLLTFVN